MIGSVAAQIVDQRVSGIVERNAETLSDELGAGKDERKKRAMAFLCLVAKAAYDLDDDDAFDGIADGGGDFGIDALYVSQPMDDELPVRMIQGNYEASRDGDAAFPEGGIARMIDAAAALFDPDRPIAPGPRLRHRVEELRSHVRDGLLPRVEAVAANNGACWTSQADKRIASAAEDFGGRVRWRHVGADELLALWQGRDVVDATINLVGGATVEEFKFRRALVGRLPVAELARLADEHGDRLFERSIRRRLGLRGNRVDEAVARTLRSADKRPDLFFHDSGVTIVCSQFSHNALQERNRAVKVKDLRIVNGGQTARTVQQVRGEGVDLDGADVLVRIYELNEGDDAVVDAITLATNDRNLVDLRDLRANDPRQAALGESVSGLGFSYRPKREGRPVAQDEFTSAVVAEAVLAVWRKRPHQARFSGRQHFGTLYDTIFTPDLNGAQAVIAAMLFRYAESRRKRPPDDAPDFAPYGSRFVAMLMGQYLLDEMGIALGELDHGNFDQARALAEGKARDYSARAEARIGKELGYAFRREERTLQRLSAAFRRADLVDRLKSADGSAG